MLYLNNWDLKKSNFLFDTNPNSRVQKIVFSFLSKSETVVKYITLGIRKVHTVLYLKKNEFKTFPANVRIHYFPLNIIIIIIIIFFFKLFCF